MKITIFLKDEPDNGLQYECTDYHHYTNGNYLVLHTTSGVVNVFNFEHIVLYVVDRGKK